MTERIKGKSFSDQSVNLDGKEFVDCQFQRCTLVYSGRGEVLWKQVQFTDCQWEFGGEAATTIHFLRAMYHSVLGGPEMVEAVFKSITRG